MKYDFIVAQRTQHRVNRLCRILEVSPSAYYEWKLQVDSATKIANVALSESIVAIHADSRGTYGRPRVHAALRARGLVASRKRVGRLMKAAGIAGITPRRFRRTTDSNHSFPIAENVVDRNFDVAAIAGPNLVWAGDITYLPTHEGWLYLAVVIDLYSRRVVGWSLKSSMRRDLVTDAFAHSDRGSQYASNEAQAQLKENGFRPSMSRKGNCWDNACVESFFGSLKSELRDPVWRTHKAARAAIFEYIEIWYNLRRLHSTLGYKSPDQFESKLPIAA